MLKMALISSVCAFSLPVSAIVVDPSFGQNGVAQFVQDEYVADIPQIKVDQLLSSVVLTDAQKRLVVAGFLSSSTLERYPMALRFDSQGKLDSSYGKAGISVADNAPYTFGIRWNYLVQPTEIEANNHVSLFAAEGRLRLDDSGEVSELNPIWGGPA
ncbi:MAG TPA: hypothetical protein VFM46_01035, partial [Pseudomonadales bacterium]|nr:hypothetical protein [Pseudomonadales bacterium]